MAQPIAYHFQNIEVQNSDASYAVRLDIQQNKVLSELYNLNGAQLQRVIKLPEDVQNSDLFMRKLGELREKIYSYIVGLQKEDKVQYTDLLATLSTPANAS